MMGSVQRLEQLAEVGVTVGANVQPGQVVQILADVTHIDTARAVADVAYRHGARFVDLQLRDAMLQRSLIIHGPAQAYAPAWHDAPAHGLDEIEGARIQINGHSGVGLFADLDPVLVDRAHAPNAACHLALGFGYPELLSEYERHRVNHSGDHLDLAIGADDVEVSGVIAGGDTVPLLRGGGWVGGPPES